MSPQQIERAQENKSDNGYGFNILKLTDGLGKPLKYTINKTMMRVELPAPLKAGQRFVFKLDWNYKIADRMSRGGRGGYEYFPEDGNHIFTICLLYTSDAADDLLCVDLGGRRHIKHKNYN